MPGSNPPVLLQQSYGEGPHYGEHRDLPPHNSISSSPFLGAGLVGKCISAAQRGQSRGDPTRNGMEQWECLRWPGLLFPYVGPAPEGVLKAVVKGAAVQRVSSVPDVHHSHCILCM